MMITQKRLGEIEQELLKIQQELQQVIVTDKDENRFGITLFQNDSVFSISRARQRVRNLSKLI
ncbi:hypothetical protein GAP32_470 [Cronobacter phage vB_CsaM_GAP32]|uniref:Uncharacterized protein n=1 Tax=Cronobacter phage vB_CsaM_GAP32 TaxID=1141136 RepID=K4F795_9CAUD|nr:hypothetical protein GAP32_470 [Cronobacter phage vB_CsaM_GAP32]AFC21928.1 hypothetical protein GAP32_470 [Cronobacter phage vB_CsaM_GAP32]